MPQSTDNSAVHSSNGDVPANGRVGRPPGTSEAEASARGLKFTAAAAAAVVHVAFTIRTHIPLGGCVHTVVHHGAAPNGFAKFLNEKFPELVCLFCWGRPHCFCL